MRACFIQVDNGIEPRPSTTGKRVTILYLVDVRMRPLCDGIAVGSSRVAGLANRYAVSATWYTPAEVVGLYWSFVDLVWIVLYPLIYLVGRGG